MTRNADVTNNAKTVVVTVTAVVKAIADVTVTDIVVVKETAHHTPHVTVTITAQSINYHQNIYNLNISKLVMAWFKKRSREIIDLTYLAKRGLIKVPQQTEDYKNIPISPNSSEPESSLGFLGAMASSAEPTISPQETKLNNKNITPNRIEDIEYKLESISKRVNAMIDRLDLVEKKLSRDLRQGTS